MPCGEVRVFHDRAAGEEERKHDHANADRVDRGLLQLRPKKNMIAAPKAGKSGIS